MAAKADDGNLSRRRLARIRCIKDCVRSFKHCKPPPKPLCYVPSEVEYQGNQNTKVVVYKEPTKKSSKVTEIVFNSETRVVVSGEELCNNEGEWGRVVKVLLDD